MRLEIELPHREPGRPATGDAEHGAVDDSLVQRLARDVQELGHGRRRPALAERGGPQNGSQSGVGGSTAELARVVKADGGNRVLVSFDENGEAFVEALLQGRHGITHDISVNPSTCGRQPVNWCWQTAADGVFVVQGPG